MDQMSFGFVLLVGIGGGLGIYAAALALGVRHGIDWDHIAAITDITSSTASVANTDESWLMGEPGLSLTDESHHGHHAAHRHDSASHSHASAEHAGSSVAVAEPLAGLTLAERIHEHREAIWLGTLYALGHGTVVTILGILAIVASEFLPSWVDGVMERIVGITLILLALYLFFSIYQYFRAGKEFRIRSRWMFVFAGVANAWHWARSRLGEHEHVAVAPSQYGARTAYGIGLVHGVGAETGTQALIIATAVGATSQAISVAVLLCFVVGLLISNSFVTLATTVGFVSARKRQTIYVAAGLVTAVLSLVVGLLFLNAWTGLLPDLDPYFRWVGGPS